MNLRELSRLSVLAIFFCFNAALATHNSDCDEMEDCRNHIWYSSSGIHFYRNLKSYPKGDWTWPNLVIDVCRRRKITFHCATRPYFCKDEKLRLELLVAKRMLNFICKDRGLQYLWRIYKEEKQCIGNATITAILRSDKQKCDAAGYDLAAANPRWNPCNLLKNSWKCEMASAEKHCSHLSEWLTYQFWKHIVKNGFERCTLVLNRDRVPFPKRHHQFFPGKDNSLPDTITKWEEYIERLKHLAGKNPVFDHANKRVNYATNHA
ncbi:hypothetical protein PoB_002117200 [Plakobranchus ocellatus]|uniref:Uncharacterized protein n=1 Tax=Plakobranchus ocellatus TaxID=259542 RepID=A0AAV3ZH65_9GAST|nr:hypothetical protein PoB_002117200 [Plakobranchus ocellatus]